MVFDSAELRWFSVDKERFWNIYLMTTFPASAGLAELSRTDHYLRLNSPNTGIKIRNGRLEMKLRSAKDLPNSFGPIQQWRKLSFNKNDPVLNSIGSDLLQDWLQLVKNRYIKKFEIIQHDNIREIGAELVNEGCAIEFTKVELPEHKKRFFTFGMEAFSSSGNAVTVLRKTIELLELDLSVFSRKEYSSYPQFLQQFKV